MADDFYSDDILWGLPPVQLTVRSSTLEPSTPDLLGLLYADYVEQEAHLSSVQADLTTTRELVHRALDRVSVLTALVQQQNARLADQAQQIRALMKCDPGQGR
jgi:ornithine cyclodeaminase/alanine dehydrogenase-like protein (mu-crystallin family)